MLIIYCICLFDGCFGSGVWQCWNCRVPFFLLGLRGTPEGGGNGPGGAALWGGLRGPPEEGGIGPGVDADRDAVAVL